VTEEAVALFRPDLILAPYLRRAIPESVWRAHVCLIVHPGIVGDRGPSALDWAILNGVPEWGVTLLQAEAEMDAGPVWAAATFAMRPAMKSSLYRNEVTEAAVRAVFTALERDCRITVAGRWQPQAQDVATDASAAAPERSEPSTGAWTIHGARTGENPRRDGFPGVRDQLFDQPAICSTHAPDA
jgi:putative two-component system protein, hydrogenase maturation factor HypX/HoxX